MQNEDWNNWRVTPRYRFRGMGSRSNIMWADVGSRSSHAKGPSRSKTSGFKSILDLPKIQKSYRDSESICGDTTATGNKDMCNIERRAKSSSVNSGNARTVTERATAYATVLWTSELAKTQAAVGWEETTRYFDFFWMLSRSVERLDLS